MAESASLREQDVIVRTSAYVNGPRKQLSFMLGLLASVLRMIRWNGSRARLAAGLSVSLLVLQPVQAEWTLSVYLGGGHTAQSSLRLQAPQLSTNLLLQPVSYQSRSFESPLYYGYRAGYFFGRHFGLEGEFIHLKVYAETDRPAQITGTLGGLPFDRNSTINSVVQRFNITHGVNLLLANFVARQSFGQSGPWARFLVSGRFGVGATIPHPENQVLGISNTEHYQIGAPAWQVGAGLAAISHEHRCQEPLNLA